MFERSKQEITIHRGGGDIVVPITLSCRRSYQLMEKDEVMLKFALMDSLSMNVGDYIDDELFGRFYIKEQQLPTYNNKTSGYDYEITFVSSSMMWANKMFMFITTLVGGTGYFRKETTWGYTSTIYGFADILRLNLLSLEMYPFINVFVDDTIDARGESRYLSFDNVDMLSALKQVADEYECEWWTKEVIDSIFVSGVWYKYEGTRVSGNEDVYVWKNGSDEVLTKTRDPFVGSEVVSGGVIGNANYGINIFFGKCENWIMPDVSNEMWVNDHKTAYTCVYNMEHRETVVYGDLLEIKEGDSAERVTPNKTESTWYNKLYVFGGTTNVPITYRKVLKFKSTAKDIMVANTTRRLYSDIEIPRTIRKTMVGDGSVMSFAGVTYSTSDRSVNAYYNPNKEDYNYTPYLEKSFTLDNPVDTFLVLDKVNSLGTIRLWLRHKDKDTGTIHSVGFGTLTIQLIVDGMIVASFPFKHEFMTWRASTYEGNERYYYTECELNFGKYIAKYGKGTHYVKIKVVVSNNTLVINGYDYKDKDGYYLQFTFPEDLKFSLKDGSNVSEPFKATICFNERDYLVLFNPNESDRSDKGMHHFCFIDENNSIIPDNAVPLRVLGWNTSLDAHNEYTMYYEGDTLKNGTKCVYGLKYVSVPYSYYIDEYDKNYALSAVGENRLKLPITKAPNGYLVKDANINPFAVKEGNIVFEDIYPRCTLRIDSIREFNGSDTTEFEDGSSSKDAFIQYYVKLSFLDGTEFEFDRRYQNEGETLKLNFIGEGELTELERETIASGGKPSQPSLLEGMSFDSEYINKEFLIQRNEEYGNKLPNALLYPKVGDWVVLTNWDVRAIEKLGLVANAEEELYRIGNEYMDAMEEDQLTFDCDMMSDVMKRREYLPVEGNAVLVSNDALREGEKMTRVFGYEFKMDYPYDTPRYMVGETDRYSRLKQIENGIYNLQHAKKRKMYGGSSLTIINQTDGGSQRFKFHDVTDKVYKDVKELFQQTAWSGDLVEQKVIDNPEIGAVVM